MQKPDSYLTPPVQGDHELDIRVTGACRYFTPTTEFQQKIRIDRTICGIQYGAQADTSPQRPLLNSTRPLEHSLSVKQSLDYKAISTFQSKKYLKLTMEVSEKTTEL